MSTDGIARTTQSHGINLDQMTSTRWKQHLRRPLVFAHLWLCSFLYL